MYMQMVNVRVNVWCIYIYKLKCQGEMAAKMDSVCKRDRHNHITTTMTTAATTTIIKYSAVFSEELLLKNFWKA